MRVALCIFLLAAASSAVCQPNPGRGPHTVETLTLNLSDGQLAYDDQGEGPLVVMLPGLGDLRQTYRFLAPALAASGYRVVTVDLRGHGESSVGWQEYTTAAVARDVLALVDHLDAGPAMVVGNSFSAGVAVWAATERPEAVAGIAMIGPFVRDHGKPSLFMRTAMAVLFNGPWKVRSWTWFHGTLFTHEHPADYETYRAALGANLRERGRFAAVKAMMNRSDAEVEARLSQVDVPTLIIMGSADPDYPDPEAEARWIAAQMNGTVEMIDKAGHYPQAEMPTETAHRNRPNTAGFHGRPLNDQRSRDGKKARTQSH